MELISWRESIAKGESLWWLSSLGYCTLFTNISFLPHVPDRNYLRDSDLWSQCQKPDNVIPWHLTLFSILLIIGAVQILICAIQVINGLLGTLCGDCQCCGCCQVSWGLCPSFSARRRPSQATSANGMRGCKGWRWPQETRARLESPGSPSSSWGKFCSRWC